MFNGLFIAVTRSVSLSIGHFRKPLGAAAACVDGFCSISLHHNQVTSSLSNYSAIVTAGFSAWQADRNSLSRLTANPPVGFSKGDGRLGDSAMRGFITSANRQPPAASIRGQSR
jgi:hypothetical protein